ncbi:MAG TPA: ATP-binding protein, partial [Pyrinomonadaceae bacterium]|nr:ATP-binding protein [Pyrinomonadaceae bacterium]
IKARETPEVLLDELGPRAFIDEAQRAPELFLAIKAIVDLTNRPGAYLLSGSNQSRMKSEVSDSLLGRAAYRTLRPLTLSELRFNESHPGWSFIFGNEKTGVMTELEQRKNSSGEPSWKEMVKAGGFPRALAADRNYRSQVLNDYVEVFVNRDIREVVGIESPERFEQFFRLMCARTGRELNASAVSNDLGISVNTVRRWIDALKRSYLIETILPYSRNASQRVIKAPKMFVVDPALALAGSQEKEPNGFHLETLVCADMLQWRDGEPNRAVYHWRLASGQEIDFIIEENQKTVPVEVKSTDRIKPRDAKHLRKFIELNPETPRGILLSCDPEIREIDDKIIAAPWWAVI